MKALILAAFATLSAQLSPTQEPRLPDREVTLDMPCTDARAVGAEVRRAGLTVAISMDVPAGTIVVYSDGSAAVAILIHENYACLLGAGDLTPTAKPQHFKPTI